MASSKTTAGGAAAPALAPLSSAEKQTAREHIADLTEIQRAKYHSIEFVRAPRLRRLGRRLNLAWVWVVELVGGIVRRLADSHKWPGRWWSRVRLYRPWKTLTPWVFLWAGLTVGCAAALFSESMVREIREFLGIGEGGFATESVKWILGWGLGGSFAALIAALWHDGIKSPYRTFRIRHRIMDEPESLLRNTIAPQQVKVMELEPPVNTVRRDGLYEELLPGVLSARKDVQIIVGVPGGGKTTALLDMAGLLAKIGFVPVLLELRGQSTSEDLFDVAKKRFSQQIRPNVRSEGETDIIWRWLCRRRRVVILVDDVDQIGFDGEPGFAIRRLLENLATEGQPVIVTARPAGVPSGVAASSIWLEPLDFETGVEIVAEPARREPGATAVTEPPRGRIERWIKAGDLTEAPLYLEALAEMTSVAACPDLPEDPERWGERDRPGRWRRVSERRSVWNPLWIRYLLLSRFYGRIVDGKVRRSLAIDAIDRQRSVGALEAAALGTLGASALGAKSTAHHGDEPKETRTGKPLRTQLVEFIDSNDRRNFVGAGLGTKRREGISQHEAIDTGERLRILERDRHGDPQFRHRIMQAFLAGRRLAKLGRAEQAELGELDPAERDSEEKVETFEQWVGTLMDHHHPEKLTAHLALTFAAIHADERSRKDPGGAWEGLAQRIVERLVAAVLDRGAPDGQPAHGWLAGILQARDGRRAEVLEQLDPLALPDPGDRRDPDDEMIKLTTAANVTALLQPKDSPEAPEEEPWHRERVAEILDKIAANEGAMRWTKLEALPGIVGLGGDQSWRVLWERFTSDTDYEVRRAAGRRLEENACCAFPALRDQIEALLLRAACRAHRGKPLDVAESDERDWTRETGKRFEALGWVLPAIVSGLGEELRLDFDTGSDPDAAVAAGRPGPQEQDEPESRLRHARAQLQDLTALAYEGGHHPLEEALAQGFKADAMRHAIDPTREICGPGWVASNRRLVADVAIPNAESWYARMLLYQSLALYAIAGKSPEDTLDVFAYRLHGTRERHPLVRFAAKLARAALKRAEIGKERWTAFIWSDDVEDGGRLPAWLDHQTAQLVGDVAILVDLKEGSPSDRHGGFGYMEELPYCLNGSKDRHEVLGTGCPQQCGWGFCPYRGASPDEPEQHRGVGRVFCRGQRRIAYGQRPSWQRSISRRRMREFWRQMEFKARR